MASKEERVRAFDTPVGTLLASCRKAFYIAFFISFLTQLMAIAPMLYMLNVYDRVLSARSGVTLVSLTVLMVGLFLFWGALDWMRSRLLARVSLRIDWDLAADVFDASFRRAVGRAGINVNQLLGDLVQLRQFITGPSVLALMDAPFAVIFIAVGFMFHPALAIFIAVASALMLIAAYATQKLSGPILKAANDSNTEATRVAAAALRDAETTVALGMMPAIRRKWHEEHRRFLQYTLNATEASGLTGGFTKFLNRALPSLQIALGAVLAIDGQITGGMVFAASMLIARAVQPITALISSWKEIVSARQSFDRINSLLEDREADDARMQLPAPTGRIDVINASAVPPGSRRPVVAEVSFTVLPGQAAAIIGPSAAGKTSLVRLLIGVWKPTIGAVRLDGAELADWSHDDVGPHIGFVPQEVQLAEATVAENIARLGHVDSDKVVAAAELAGIHEIILTFPDGYDTKVGGEKGFALSGGQRQRIGIARALYGDPKYIVMDEPNSSLDEVGENALINAIQTMKERGASLVITTHRPRLLSVVDNLLVLRGGKQVGFGPAAEILAAVRGKTAPAPLETARSAAG